MNEHLKIVNIITNTPTPIKQDAKAVAKSEEKPEALKFKEKKEVPHLICDVEKDLKSRNLCLFKICNKTDKDRNLVKTKMGKVVRNYIPYRMIKLRVCINNDGFRLQWWDDKCTDKWIGTGITEKEYKAFLNTASIKKRIDLFLKYNNKYVLRKIKHNKRIEIRVSEEEYRSVQELAAKIGKRKVSELLRKRIRGTILHEALSAEEKQAMKALLQMATELKQYGTALKNYLKTTGTAGAQRLDLLFQSQPGTDYSKAIFAASRSINKLIRYSDDN